MKLILASILVVSARAFVPHAVPFGTRQSITYTLQATSNEDAIQEALRISKENGATSQEARVAWDIVEELNASDNSAAFKGGLSDDDCQVDAPPEACDDYNAGVEAIAALKDTRLEPDAIIAASKNSIAESVRPISLGSSSSSGSDSAAVTAILQSALENAKKITAELGITSSEAKLAWEDVEEIASSGTSEATKTGLDTDECLVEKIEACEALEELDRVIHLESNKDNGRYQG